MLKVNESQYKQFGVIPHFFNGQNLLKKIQRILIYNNKINIDTINCEKLFPLGKIY